jgi:hypothetical protein
MVKKVTRKSITTVLVAISLAAFLFVNLHANLVVRKQMDASALIIREKIEQKEEPKREVPSIALIGKVVKLIYYLAPSLR